MTKCLDPLDMDATDPAWPDSRGSRWAVTLIT